MSIVLLNPAIVRISGKFPLPSIPVVSCVVQIAAAVGLVGYVWFQNGQQAVNQVATQSIDAEADRINPPYEVLVKALAVLINYYKFEFRTQSDPQKPVVFTLACLRQRVFP